MNTSAVDKADLDTGDTDGAPAPAEDAAFWCAVGGILRLERTKLRISTTKIRPLGGPSQKTVEKIEDGEYVEVARLAAYARALGLSLVDIFSEALARSEPPAFSRGAVRLARWYDGSPDPDARQLLVGVARRILGVQETPASDQ
jgi:DNA-binding XRE family transcriptional regulator